MRPANFPAERPCYDGEYCGIEFGGLPVEFCIFVITLWHSMIRLQRSADNPHGSRWLGAQPNIMRSALLFGQSEQHVGKSLGV
jgi:hypothetical protein